VLETVRELLEEGAFHGTTVEEVADRAGVSRATLYQHFGSRLGLIDAICDTIGENEHLRAIRATADLESLVALVVDFWASEERLLVQLYGAAAVDPAAHAFVERQRRDRYGELRRLLGRDDPDAFAALAALTSFETYLELRRHARRPRRDVVATLARAVRSLVA
jgi:AcrR family transcriptional regulator